MPILSIDTTTKVATVAVVELNTVLSEVSLGVQRNHAERILPAVDYALREAGVKRESLVSIAVGSGPGSFTGLRIGMSLAKGLAEGLGIPLVPVSTLEVLASQCRLYSGYVIPLLDAQREQFYTGVFRISLSEVQRVTEDQVVGKAEFSVWISSFADAPCVLTGEAGPETASLHGLRCAPSELLMPRASTLGLLAVGRSGVDPRRALPNYIRSSSAQPRKGCV